MEKNITDGSVRITELQNRVAEIDERSKNSEHMFKTIEIIAKFITAGTAVSVVMVAFFGWSNLKEMNNQIQGSIEGTVSTIIEKKIRTEGDSIDLLKKSYKDADEFSKKFDNGNKRFKEIVDALSKTGYMLDFVGTDYSGEFNFIINEQKKRKEPSSRFDSGYDVNINDTIYDQSFRARAQSLFSTMLSEKSKATAEDLFNASAIASGLKFNDLAAGLANMAARDGRLAHVARSLRFQFKDGKKDAFSALMNQVRNLTLENPELVLSEAWNVAESARNYYALIQAINDRVLKGDGDSHVNYIPSYAYIIAAEAHMRVGTPQDIEKAREKLQIAEERLRHESPQATWYGSSLQEGREISALLEKTDQAQKAGALFIRKDSANSEEQLRKKAILLMDLLNRDSNKGPQ